MKSIEYFQGCVLGGAIGDALGYPIEFDDIKDIKARFGINGIQAFIQKYAEISDDTQMTLFTMNGLLIGETRKKMRGISGSMESYIYKAYLDWLWTQMKSVCAHLELEHNPVTWLSNCKELWASREPGTTCIHALGSGAHGTLNQPINDSKGCGGLMRVAPIGLYYARIQIDQAGEIAAKAAALTHGHELSLISSYMFADCIYQIITKDQASFPAIIQTSLMRVCVRFHASAFIKGFQALIKQAMHLSKSNLEDVECIGQLGEGWVAEEAIAIAIFCSFRYEHDYFQAIKAAVNHSGDSDSTGSITGNLLGAYLGIQAIPKTMIQNLELHELINDLTIDLYQGCRMSEYSSIHDQTWIDKYIEHTYVYQSEI